jgi:hypothetical protein
LRARSRPGAYGLALPDLPDAAELLVDAPAGWMDWHIERREDSGRPSEFVGDAHARLRSAPSGWVDVDRARQTSTFNLPRPVRDREVVHPYLASTASVTAHWQGMQSFHAGAFVIDDRVWAVLGDRGAGKSSLLAHLALEGVPILTDDVLVIREGVALAGPRCIDLRAEPASRFKVGEALGVVGRRERWRLQLDPVQPELPMAGWICLAWGGTSIDVVQPQDSLMALFANLSLRVDPSDPATLVDLLALPMVLARRRPDFSDLGKDAASLLRFLDQGRERS